MSTYFVTGATGFIGRRLVGALLAREDCAAVHVLVREASREKLAQAAKRWPRLVRTADPGQGRQKLFAFLRRRGFSSAVAQQILAELTQGTEGDG